MISTRTLSWKVVAVATHVEKSGTTANETSVDDVKRLERISLQDSLLNLYLPLLIAGFAFGFAATGNFPGNVMWWLTPVLFVVMGLILMAGNKHRQRLHNSSHGDLFHVEGSLLLMYTVLLAAMLALVYFGSQILFGLSLAQYAGWIVGNDNLGFYHNVERGHPIAQIMMLLRPIAMGLVTGIGFSGLLNATATSSTRLQSRETLVADGKHKLYRTAKRNTYNAWLLVLRFLSNGIVALVLTVLGVSFWMGISMISVIGL